MSTKQLKVFDEDFIGVNKAIHDGLRMIAFCSGTNLRVINLNNTRGRMKGYGQHAILSSALRNASHNYLTKEDSEEIIEVNYGVSEDSSLDRWVGGGSRIVATKEYDLVKVQLFITSESPFIHVKKPTFYEAYTTLNSIEFPPEWNKYYVNDIIVGDSRRYHAKRNREANTLDAQFEVVK